MEKYFDKPSIKSAKILLLLQIIFITFFIPTALGLFEKGGAWDFDILITGLIMFISSVGIIASPIAGFIDAFRLLKNKENKNWGIILIFSSSISLLVFLWGFFLV